MIYAYYDERKKRDIYASDPEKRKKQFARVDASRDWYVRYFQQEQDKIKKEMNGPVSIQITSETSHESSEIDDANELDFEFSLDTTDLELGKISTIPLASEDPRYIVNESSSTTGLELLSAGPRTSSESTSTKAT